MLRITEKIESEKSIRLRLDGTITPESFEDLEKACVASRGENERIVILDMAGVNFMHAESAQKLAGLRGEFLRIINCSPFIATLLDTIGKLD
jgi:anti-anti-sigma regulatory factor